MESQTVLNARAGAPPLSRLSLAFLDAAVVGAGAAVMIYEFIAVRILTRFFGGSLDVWASVIAVLLAGLSAGYAMGGLLAERFGTTRPVGGLFVLAGATGLFMERIAVAVGEKLLAVERAVMWHPYIAACLVSFIPVLALGAVLPQAIKIHARQTARVGSAAGYISGISTLGNILGVLLTVHVLLPRLGVRETLYGTSVVLIVFGAMLAMSRTRPAASAAWALVGLCLYSSAAPAQTLYENYSAYHHIIVQDVPGRRVLRFDNAPQSTMSLQDFYAGGFEYTEFFHVPVLFDPTIDSVLFIGLGGGTGPKAFLRDYPRMRVDVAEIDPEVLWVAQTYFGLPADIRLRTYICDGRVYLQRSSRRYGAIIVDAYASGPSGAYLPYHLVTQEFFQLVWQRLRHGGCLVYNVVGVYGGIMNDVFGAIYSTMCTAFQAVYAFQAMSSSNTVFVAQKFEASSVDDEEAPAWPKGPWVRHPLTAAELRDLARTAFQNGLVKLPVLDQRVTQLSPIQGVMPLESIYTDNYAPVDIGRGGQSYALGR